MGKGSGAERSMGGGGSFLKLAWLDGVLIALGVLALVGSLLLSRQPEWTLRGDIQQFNKGVTAFNQPPGLLPPGDGRPAEYPIERAAWHWAQAAVHSTDLTLKSLAYYDLGTLSGREAWAQALPGEGHARTDMAEGLQQLGESLRADPSNEDAKFNLE